MKSYGKTSDNVIYMKKLPIAIQCFADIRTGNYCYADKTPLIARLVEQGRFYFLSRPRRFGKSLLLDTLAEAFVGRKGLTGMRGITVPWSTAISPLWG